MSLARDPQALLHCLACLWVFFLSPNSNAQSSTLPKLAQVKERAEQGDPQAQDRLGDAYKGQFDFASAVKWYRPAAEHGLANSQWNLGMILLSGRPGTKDRAIAADPDAGVKWLLKAANQGFERAQIDLGHCFRNGRAVKQDLVEAYKWYAIAASQDVVWRAMYLDPLVLQMTTKQVAEGQRRAAAFKPSRDKPMALPEPACFSRLMLKGILGPKERRLALINKQAFGVGDEQEVKLDGMPFKVRCLEIRDRSVLISVVGFEGEKELMLP